MKEFGLCISSVQFSHSVVSNSLRPRESQHARPPCPSPTPGVYSNSYPSSQWCHPAISSSVIPFSSCPQSLPASGSFPMSQIVGRGAFFKSRDMGKIIIITLHNSTSNFLSTYQCICCVITLDALPPFSRGSSWSRDQTWVSHIAGRFFTIWATRKTLI